MRSIFIGVLIGAGIPLGKLGVELLLTRVRAMRADEISRMMVMAANVQTRAMLGKGGHSERPHT